MIKLQFDIRMGEFIVRSCDKNLMQKGDHMCAEIVKWCSIDTCFTIAHWDRDSDGFYLKFVGDRPMEECDPHEFFNLVRMGQLLLDKWEVENG